MSATPHTPTPAIPAFDWASVSHSLARPYRVPLSLIVLLALVPLYILVPEFYPPATRYAPELALDRALPLVPSWSIVYGALYLFLILLPVFVVRQDDLIRRTIRAYLLVWITAYVCFFIAYPTVAPRPANVTGEGFGVWGLRALYSSDPPINCFPSLHVAHSFVSAFACYRVHRRLGAIAGICASFVGLSTLLTKQHYVVDVVAGIALAALAYGVFLRKPVSPGLVEFDRRAAPSLAWCVAATAVIGVAAAWIAYLWAGERHFSFGS